jgi:hypothetical protein
MIVFSPYPIPITINQTKQEGYILYVNDSGQFENDVFCIVLKENGELLHATIKQFTVVENVTFGIKKSPEGL